MHFTPTGPAAVEDSAPQWAHSPTTRRVAFYNDLGVTYALNTIQSSLNASKGASGPEQWLPPANRCRYVEVWTALRHRWALSVDAVERTALLELADQCPNNVVTVPRA